MGALIGMGAMGLFASFMAAEGASSAAEGKKLQWEEQEFQREFQNRINNRNLTNANAAKWMHNQRLEEEVNQSRAEQEFWVRYNFDNASGAHGKNTKAITDQLLANLSGRKVDPKSGSAKSLLKSASNKALEDVKHGRVEFGATMETIERQQKRALAARDFNFNEHIPFLPGAYGGPSGSEAFTMTLMSGIAQTGSAMFGAAME